MQKTFLFLILIYLGGCNDVDKHDHSPSSNNTIQEQTKKDSLVKGNEFEEGERLDSTRLSRILDTALQYATQHQNQMSFKYKFEMSPDDAFTANVEMRFGYLFEPGRKHLLICRLVPWAAIFNIYLLENEKFRSVCEKENARSHYLDYSLKDINGDNYKDFLAHWYSSVGCCVRNVYDASLYQQRSGEFTAEYKFMNPIFFPKEKIIRGVEYGHPGEIGLYKYKWNHLQIDTIEFIYPYLKEGGKFIKTKTQQYRPTKEDGIVLNSLPKESRSIESIEWFLDY